jgi:putative transcriptional regulator
MYEDLKEKIAGEIAISEDPGATIRKWREEFGISQQELSRKMDISPSMISDYESGRRRYPRILTVRKIVDALIDIDLEKGGKNVNRFTFKRMDDSILDIKEFMKGMGVEDFASYINGEIVNTNYEKDRALYGYTVIDSLKAILSMSAFEYIRIYGWTSERALIFTEVSYGRSPMIAIRANPLKPAMVVYVRPKSMDELAVKLADIERIPLVRTPLDEKSLIERLRNLEE